MNRMSRALLRTAMISPRVPASNRSSWRRFLSIGLSDPLRMTRLTTIVGLLLMGLLSPLSATAFWFPNDGQCEDLSSVSTDAVGFSDHESSPGCTTVLDPTDPSYNACFAFADAPISTLPELIAQAQAERVVAGLLAGTKEVLRDSTPMADPEPLAASLEDPAAPGQQLMERPMPRPRPRPNSCAVFPDDCEAAPTIPILNLEASTPQADWPASAFEVPPPVEPPARRGPPAEGIAPSNGVMTRLDRPPQVG